MIRKPSPEEKVKSILDAREGVFECLTRIGKVEAFNDFSKDDMCELIRAAHDGVQSSLHQQLADVMEDEIPFG